MAKNSHKIKSKNKKKLSPKEDSYTFPAHKKNLADKKGDAFNTNGIHLTIVKEAIEQAENELEKLKQSGAFKNLETFLKLKSETEAKIKEALKTAKHIRNGDKVVMASPLTNFNKPQLDKNDIDQSVKQAMDEVLEKYDMKRKYDNLSNQIPIFLSSDGDLYCKPKEKLCYHMDADSLRFKIIKSLTSDYKKTALLLEELDVKSYQSFYDAIRNINRKAIERLKIKDKIIEGRKGNGFRINPKYKIAEE